jgi:hypothetical protein
MASSNTNIQVADLDFNSIKTNFTTYLQSQDTFKDYNFQGSALSTLLDVLAYNTQYNAYYLNMVANEMFLDSALQRSSVVSQAKLLNYTPKSAIAPQAIINFTANGVIDTAFTLPRFTNFLSEAIAGVNYNFVTTDSVTVNVHSGTATLNNLVLKQGAPSTFTYTVNGTTNPKYTFEIPDANIDTTTIQVTVQQSTSNSSFEVYKPASNFLSLKPTSLVYFLQEGLSGNYQIYFGDDILGKKLSDNNIVNISYISTKGIASTGANNFVLMDSIPTLSTHTITPVKAATNGGSKESIDSIKYQAPKSYSAQNRAVSKEDYITIIQQNNLGVSFDAVNVWGGEQNDPVVYGQVFIALKPKGAYSLTNTQKQRLISDVIKPISVLTVEPTIVDPDYTYIQSTINVVYDPKKTSLTANGISSAVKTAISTFATTNLNTFNSTFSVSDLILAIKNASQSIVTNEVNIQLQKKFYPNLSNSTNYKFNFNVPIKKGTFLSGISSSPSIAYTTSTGTYNNVFIEEVPVATTGVDTISILNAGYGYQYAPNVTIIGDGTGATAVASINVNGTIKSITVTNSGNNYTTAYATIIPVTSDNTGRGAVGVVNLQGRYGTLRTYYNNTNNGKTILNTNVGTIDYATGTITLTAFNPSQINNALGQLTLSVTPTTTIVSSTFNRIITIDPFDSNAILVNVTAKTT